MMDLKKLTESAIQDQKKGKTLSNLVKNQEQRKKNFVPTNDLEVDDVYQSLIRKQTDQEQAQLEASIKEEGIRDALVVYDREGTLVVVDGHHRLNMAKKLGMEVVPIQQMTFKDPDEARVWMLRNQLGRRNLNDAERIEIALKLTEFLEKLGQINKIQGKDLSANLHKGREAQKIDRLEEASKIANVSRRNVAKYKKIHDEGDESLRKEVLEGKKSIHKAHEQIAKKQTDKPVSTAKPRKYRKKVEEVFSKMEDWKAGKVSNEEMKAWIDQYIK